MQEHIELRGETLILLDLRYRTLGGNEMTCPRTYIKLK